MLGVVLNGAIIVGSFCLLAYWFRYICLVLVAGRAPALGIVAESRCSLRGMRTVLRRELLVNIVHVCEVAAVNELSFPEVQALLLAAADVDLDALCESLDQDYVLIHRVLNLGPSRLRAPRYLLFVLASDYRLLKAWYRVKQFLSLHSARETLEEMTWLVSHFASRAAAF